MLAIFEQEQRASRFMSVQDHANTRLNAAMRRIKRQQEVLTSLAQQGITWDELKKPITMPSARVRRKCLNSICLSFIQQ